MIILSVWLIMVVIGTAAEMPVYLVIGQSNATGSSGSNSMLDGRAGFPDSRITIWSHITGGATLLSNVTLRVPASAGNWSVEMHAGQLLADWHGENIAIVKVSAGGTDLWEDWAPDNTNGLGCYASLTNWYAIATADLAVGGDTPSVKGAIWIQGEQDSIDGHHAEYYANLTNFISRIRTDFGQEVRFGIARLSRFAGWRAGYLTVRAAQEQAGTGVANTYLVDADPCYIPYDDGLGRHSSHYDQPGLWDLGGKCGRGMIAEQTAVASPSGVFIKNKWWSE